MARAAASLEVRGEVREELRSPEVRGRGKGKE